MAKWQKIIITSSISTAIALCVSINSASAQMNAGDNILLSKNQTVINQLPLQEIDGAILSREFLANEYTPPLEDNAGNIKLSEPLLSEHQLSEHQRRFNRIKKKSFPQLELRLEQASDFANKRRLYRSKTGKSPNNKTIR